MKLTQEQRKAYKDYIVECISDEGDPDFESKTKREKVQYLKNRFDSEYGWRLKQVG